MKAPFDRVPIVNLESLPKTNRASIRGSAVSTRSPESNEIIQNVNQIAQAQFLVERSMNEMAVLFSRGLVDSETGTIEVEKVDYSDLQNGFQPQRK